MTRQTSDLTIYVALFVIALFGALAATAYIKSLLDPLYHPDTTLTAMATGIVGASIAYIVRKRNGNGRNSG